MHIHHKIYVYRPQIPAPKFGVIDASDMTNEGLKAIARSPGRYRDDVEAALNELASRGGMSARERHNLEHESLSRFDP